MFGLGAGEIFIILAFALIFIGPKKLPELARNLGKGIREFQKAKDDLMSQVNDASRDELAQDHLYENHDKDNGDHEEEDHHPSLTGVNGSEEEENSVLEEVEKMKSALQSVDDKKSS